MMAFLRLRFEGAAIDRLDGNAVAAATVAESFRNSRREAEERRMFFITRLA
jgi:hypothetical protein